MKIGAYAWKAFVVISGRPLVLKSVGTFALLYRILAAIVSTPAAAPIFVGVCGEAGQSIS